jgi:nitrous oxidase accessory protein NosD
MGFILNDGSRHNILQQQREGNSLLPMRLQPKETNSVRWVYGVQDARRSNGIREGVKQIFVETSCGRVFKGGSREWRRYTNHSLAIWPRRPPSPSPQIS